MVTIALLWGNFDALERYRGKIMATFQELDFKTSDLYKMEVMQQIYCMVPTFIILDRIDALEEWMTTLGFSWSQ